MNVSDFNYNLPEELIAQHPALHRQDSKMMVMDRASGECHIHVFSEITDFIYPGDCIVINDTKVL
ncbi:MAG: S-adenosylmethionine:tRNA ribosyltransferase-isomerase [Victivallales bacterium]|nr:S-adenosylmethionine:tRNA ribosyltransferase-isomerase [Victivallales bacterium]